jgi:hypothetical protein
MDEQLLLLEFLEFLLEIWRKEEEKLQVQALLFITDSKQGVCFTGHRHPRLTASCADDTQLLAWRCSSCCWRL